MIFSHQNLDGTPLTIESLLKIISDLFKLLKLLINKELEKNKNKSKKPGILFRKPRLFPERLRKNSESPIDGFDIFRIDHNLNYDPKMLLKWEARVLILENLLNIFMAKEPTFEENLDNLNAQILQYMRREYPDLNINLEERKM